MNRWSANSKALALERKNDSPSSRKKTPEESLTPSASLRVDKMHFPLKVLLEEEGRRGATRGIS